MSKPSVDIPEEQDTEPVEEEQGTATAISFFTAARWTFHYMRDSEGEVRIARWMAKAYGYAEKRKDAYRSSQVEGKYLLKFQLMLCLVSSSWVVGISVALRWRQTLRNWIRKKLRPRETLSLAQETSLRTLRRSQLMGNIMTEIIVNIPQMVRWLAKAYGLRDAAYYEAYNRELHRQAKNVMCPWVGTVSVSSNTILMSSR